MTSNKTAIQYIRISDKDQSHFSLDGQQETNQRYADRMGIQIIRTYIDNGESARDFDRPNWKKLMKDLEANKSNIDFLIVMKYDRLIRNAAQGLMALEKIEMRWNIKVLSSTEQISIDPNSPFFFKFRADMLVNAEFERRVISERSKFGRWRANSEGRFLGVAPFGYINSRDENNKPIILLDESEKQDIIRESFRMVIEGRSIAEVYQYSKSKGCTLKGHSAIQRMVTNPVYAGLIEVPAFKDESAKIIKARHTPIVSEHDYKLAKEIIEGPTRGYSKASDEFFLRGLVKCHNCGAKLTASKVQGKLKKYPYYNCGKCRWNNINADTAHKQLKSILTGIQLGQKEVDYIIRQVTARIEEYLYSNKSKKRTLQKQRQELQDKLDNVEEKYISSQLDSDVYNKWSRKYTTEKNAVDYQLSQLEAGTMEYWNALHRIIPSLSNLNFIFDKANVPQKQDILRYLFSGDIVLTKNGYRTPFLLPFIKDKAKGINYLDIIETGTTTSDNAVIPACTPNGKVIEHFANVDSHIAFFKLLNKIA